MSAAAAMPAAAMLRPVAALAAWTLLMLALLVARRLPALKAAGIDLAKVRGGRGQDLETVVPAATQWPAHNYAHLVEQPTLFYAVALALAIAGDATPAGVGLAWGYVGLRVVHSLWQVTVNIVAVRFVLFTLATATLAALTVHALALLF